MSKEPSTPPSDAPAEPDGRRKRRLLLWTALVVGLATFAVVATLTSIFERRQEARTPFVRTVEVHEGMSDPSPWGVNWPRQFDSYKRTVDVTRTRYGGSSAMPEQKLDEHPWLRRLYAGYAFSIDYRERRGHAYMLYDQTQTERVTKRNQAGACLHCHASVIPMYRRLGLEAMGKEADAEALAGPFDWAAVMKGFEITSTMDYVDAHRELLLTPDGTPRGAGPVWPGQSTVDEATPSYDPGRAGEMTNRERLDAHVGEAHPVSCVDCHAPDTMEIRVTRPGFVRGIRALAEGDAAVPHLPSIERWREGDRDEPYDPNRDASRQEMRSFVCGQCHVEYYCASREALFFPWDQGLRVEQIEDTFDAHRFPDGEPFYDFLHAETGARIYKAQHPEFEMWSQGIHAQAGVSCSDCHMPYEREGAMKVSSHWVKSPLLNINSACQTCHNVPESELLERVHTIQDRTRALIDRSAEAMTEMLDAIAVAQEAGASEEELAPIFALQRKAMWRLDFVASENSMGFHADQETARILAESIDYSRRAAMEALTLRAPAPAPAPAPPPPDGEAVEGVTPSDEAPPGNY